MLPPSLFWLPDVVSAARFLVWEANALPAMMPVLHKMYTHASSLEDLTG
jgi:hypothetical protein